MQKKVPGRIVINIFIAKNKAWENMYTCTLHLKLFYFNHKNIENKYFCIKEIKSDTF